MAPRSGSGGYRAGENDLPLKQDASHRQGKQRRVRTPGGLAGPFTEEGVTSLAEAIAELLWRRGLRARQRRRRLEEAWQRALGDELSKRLHLGSWQRGVLEVWTDDAALLHRLVQFDSQRVLVALQRELGPGYVSRLRFRLGRT
ncbi:MAG: DciA family protein [Gemmatales bacterium]|nr:DciA family protein [Gemmatales bacterium]